MVPLVRGYSTEQSLEVTSAGVQVHGGMGFIEETGAPSTTAMPDPDHLREGTTAIQANDLVGRKTTRDGGQTAKAIAAQVESHRGRADCPGRSQRRRRGQKLKAARLVLAFIDVVEFIVANGRSSRMPRLQAACPT